MSAPPSPNASSHGTARATSAQIPQFPPGTEGKKVELHGELPEPAFVAARGRVESRHVEGSPDEVAVPSCAHKTLDPTWVHDVIRVALRDEVTRRRLEAYAAGVVAASASRGVDNAEPGEAVGPRAHDVHRSIGRTVVGDDDLPVTCVGLNRERCELIRDVFRGVERGDDNRDQSRPSTHR